MAMRKGGKRIVQLSKVSRERSVEGIVDPSRSIFASKKRKKQSCTDAEPRERRHFGCVGDILCRGGGMMERPLKKKRREYWASSEDLSLSPPLPPLDATQPEREKQKISISPKVWTVSRTCLGACILYGTIYYLRIYSKHIEIKRLVGKRFLCSCSITSPMQKIKSN